MKISYAILTHNETKSLDKLLSFLIEYKDEEDEIVILDDFSDDEKTIQILETYVSIYDLKYEQRQLLDDFSDQKNYLSKMCTGDYIFNLDSDEIPHKKLMKNIKTVLELNPSVDLYYVPRVNTVKGITQEHIDKWGWNINEKKWINFPDWQTRIYRRRPNIIWQKPVHETLTGFREYTYLPAEKEWAIKHKKDIDRQEKQNEFYTKI
jgi:glycosyltransferase involved in cell wall biosynthesis